MTVRRWWLGACLALLAPVAGAVEVEEDVRYYDVTGETPAEIWREMRLNGPVGKDGGKYNATTPWNLRWRYPYERSADGCATGPVTVKLSVVFNLPRWDRPAGASAAVARQWDRYIEALEEHEEGHADFGRRTASEIERALEEIPPQRTCEDLSRLANDTGREILEETRPKEREYDRRTNHGATQGTAFFRDLAEGRSTSR